MSTSLALGVVGGVIGGLFGGPVGAQIGFLAGSLIGNLIDPPKVEGPRLSDLKIQKSSYGATIPYVWGTGRIAGNCIDQTDLEEHEQTSGGKGGTETTSYTYSATFALMLAAAKVFGEPAILGIKRIWADGRLIWSDTTGDDMPCTLYTGTETQLPDPTLEAIHGVGSTPAYRGLAYVVFADYYLTDYFNRIPQLEFEVYTATSDAGIPSHLSTWVPEKGVLQYTVNGGELRDGKLWVGTYESYAVSSATFDWTLREYELDGTFVQIIATTPGILVPVSGAAGYIDGVQNSCSLGYGYAWGEGVEASSCWYYQGATNNTPIVPGAGTWGFFANTPSHSTFPFVTGNEPGDHLYCIGANNSAVPAYVCRYDIGLDNYPSHFPAMKVDGITRAVYLFPDAPISGVGCQVTCDDDGFVYVIKGVGATAVYELLKLDADLNLLETWTGADFPSANCGGVAFKVHQGRVLLGGPVSGGGSGVRVYDLSHPMAQVGITVPVIIDPTDFHPFVSLDGCLALSNDGLWDMCATTGPESLRTIVENLCDMTPLTGDHDATELTDDVNWFAVASNMTARNAIQSLRPVYFFDGTESDDVAKFKKRGGPPTFSIPDSSLQGRNYGEAAGDPLRTTRAKEQGLPRTVSMTFINIDSDYQPGTESSPRQVTTSQQDVTLQVPVGLTNAEAAQKCWAVQCAEWIEREQFEFSCTRGAPVINIDTSDTFPAAMLEPCDVGIVRGREVRILTRNESPAGVIKFTAVLSAPSIYTQTAPGSGVGGFTPPVPPGARVNTNLVLYGMTMRDDNEASEKVERGIYAAASAATSGKWTGYGLFKSIDGGATYNEVASTAVPTTMGTTVDALPSFVGGRHIFDELSTVDVLVGPGGGTLESVTETLALAGENMFVIGNEWVIAKNCELVASDTWRLSGLLRGMRGTESAIHTHVAGERWALASELLYVDCPETQLFQSHLYKAVTFGKPVAGATPISFANMAVGALCYSPVHLRGGPNAGGDIVVECTRRTRIGGAWLNYVDAAQGEDLEQYIVQIWDESFTTCAHVSPILTSPYYTYTASDQTTEFGSPQGGVYASVGQIGAYGLGQQVRGLIPGGAGGINAPIVSVPPYGGTPSSPPSGGGGAVNSALTWPYQLVLTAGYRIGDTWVASFTTAASGTISGNISAAEYGYPAYTRHSWLSPNASGVPVIAGTEQQGNSTMVILSPSNVANGTTYYFIVKTEYNGVPSGPVGELAQMVITLSGAPP